MQHVNSASVFDEREFNTHNISVWVVKRAVTYEYLPCTRSRSASPVFLCKTGRHWGSNRQLSSLMWTRLLPAELGWGPRPMGPWLDKSMIHSCVVWLYLEGQLPPPASPLGSECGNTAVTWQEWESLHFFPNSINPYFCQGLAPSVTLPHSWLLLLSTQTCSKSFLRQKKKKKKKKETKQNKTKNQKSTTPFPKMHYVSCLGKKGRINGEKIKKGKDKNSSVCSQSLSLLMVSAALS